MVKGDRYDATPSLNPSLFLAHSSGLLVEPARSAGTQGLCTRRYVGVRARARVFPIACSFLGLVKHNGTNWGKRVVGGVGFQNIQSGNSITQAPRTSSKPVTYLPTYTRYLLFLSLLALRLPARGASGMALGQGHVSRGAHWPVAQ